MSDQTLKNIHTAAGSSSSEQTMANLIRLRMEREMDLETIFKSLGLVRGRDTAADAVEIINALFEEIARLENLTK